MTSTEHHHTMQLDSITAVPGLTGRTVKAHCTTCPEVFEQLTAKTDDEIQAAIDEANANA